MTQLLTAWIFLIITLDCAGSPRESLANVQADPNFVDLSKVSGVVIDLRYASTNNLTGINLYGAFNRAFLRVEAAKKFSVAVDHLKALEPQYKFLVLDAARPRSVQKVLWNTMRAGHQRGYVADPSIGSIHNYGMAIDLTIVDAHGKELDMGTGFDSFDELSQPILEQRFLAEGRLSKTQIANRQLLRKVMQSAGFVRISKEWWHFEIPMSEQMRMQYKIIE